MCPAPFNTASIDIAVAALRRGELIGLPTETVYGLAADAMNAQAVAKIFALKGRPSEHPLIVHLGSAEQLSDWAIALPTAATELAKVFWPGPMTLILKRAARVGDWITGAQNTVGVRVPKHAMALRVLAAFGGGLAAPSANRFGHVSPTTAGHVRAEFGAALPIVLDGGACAVGIESTIIDLSQALPRILRPGHIARAAIEAVIGPIAEGAAELSPRVSGSLLAHYAPRTPAQLCPRQRLSQRALAFADAGKRALVLSIGELPANTRGRALPAQASGYAQQLYAELRALDVLAADIILIESPRNTAAWAAIRDRLQRAVAGTAIQPLQAGPRHP